MTEYTHTALTKAGYIRHVFPEYPGWVTYTRGLTAGTRAKPRVVGFAGNDATMNNWIENVSCWKTWYPKVYAWWIDPKQQDPYYESGELIIKGEDPLKKEAQDGHTSFASVV